MSDYLDSGDRIELSRSHELRIDGDVTWIGMKASTTIREFEGTEHAMGRLSQMMAEAMDNEIDKTVEYVRNKK